MYAKKKILTYTFGILAFLVLVLIVYSHVIIERAAEGRIYSDITKVPHKRVGMVLGCSKKLKGGRNNLFFIYRVEAAVKLFQAGKIDYILVSGDNSRQEYNESGDMKQALADKGVPSGHIFCDYAGFRTLDSIVRANKVFQEEDILVISQKFHNKRAMFIAKKHGISADAYNAREVGSYHSFRTRVREVFAKVKTVLDIHILHTEPKFYGPPIHIVASGKSDLTQKTIVPVE